jgi:hypothetical protein
VPPIKRSSSSVVRAEMNRQRDIAVADAQRRGIKAKAWDAYPGGVMLELSDSDTDTEDETEPETDLQKAARNLSRDGAVVLKLFTEEEIERYRQKLLEEELPAMPEFAQPVTKYVDGGFGALANPASFHNPTVREMRKQIAKRTWNFFKAVCKREHPGESGWRLEQLIDRLALRLTGSSTSEEAWHRDQSPTLDTVFGGWVNLDLPTLGGMVQGTQYFSCNLRTHRTTPEQAGFVKLKKKTPEFEAAKLAKTVLSVAPGHWVVFFQNLIHEVHPRKMTYDSLRLFVGFRLTKSLRPLFDEVKPGSKPEERKAFGGAAFEWRKYVFDDQGVPPISSWQYPPLWSMMTLSTRNDKLKAWSAEFTPPYQQPEKGYPVRFMQSLRAAGLQMYPKYEEAEIAIHTPRLLDAEQAAPGMNASSSSAASSVRSSA